MKNNKDDAVCMDLVIDLVNKEMFLSCRNHDILVVLVRVHCQFIYQSLQKKKTLLNSHEKVSSTDITSEQRKRRKTRPHHSLFDLLLVRRMTETIAIPANEQIQLPLMILSSLL